MYTQKCQCSQARMNAESGGGGGGGGGGLGNKGVQKCKMLGSVYIPLY